MTLPNFSAAESLAESYRESDAVLDFLDFKVSVKSAEETSFDNNKFNFMPTESVYYAAEYLRLQSEIDSWKEKATKYKQENEDLKKEVTKQCELVDKLTKEKTQQCVGFQLGLGQLKRDNSKLTTTLKKFGAANRLYIEKYKRLKSQHEKAKRECSELKSTKENETRLQHDINIYWKTLQFLANFLDKCNNQLETCVKRLNGDTVELSSNIPQFTSRNLNQVNSRLANNITTILAKVGLNSNPNENTLLDNANTGPNSIYQNNNHGNCGSDMITNNLLRSLLTNHQPQATVSATPIAATKPSYFTFHRTARVESSGGYHPSTSPVTPDDVDLDIIHGSWNGGQVFQNMV